MLNKPSLKYQLQRHFGIYKGHNISVLYKYHLKRLGYLEVTKYDNLNLYMNPVRVLQALNIYIVETE